MPKPIVLRFRVSGVFQNIRDHGGPDGKTRPTELHNVTLRSLPNPELWPLGLPDGQIQLDRLPPEVWAHLRLGQEFAVTLAPISATDDHKPAA